MASSSAVSYPAAYTTSGSISGTRYKNAVGKGADTSAVSGNDYASGGSSSKAYIYYSFDFSAIPSDATINSVACQVKGHAENTSRSTCNVQLYVGTSTAKGSASKFTSTSAQTLTLTTGSWTRSEVADMRLRFEIGYYGGLVNGATVTVTYTWNDIKWTVTVSGDHATPSGATEVSDGQPFVLKVTQTAKPTVTDNNVDVSSSLVQKQDSPESYAVEQASGTSYGFALNASGYYESNNTGHANSCALAIVRFHLPVSATITFDLINYAESGYDFGLLSEIDKALSTAHSADSSNVYWSGEEHNSSAVQHVTYQMAAGDHEIYVKYFKDQYTDSGNDSLQFKVSIALDETPTYDTYWEYTIAAVGEDHVVIVTTDGQTAILRYHKAGGAWVLDGEVAAVHSKSGTWAQADPANIDPTDNYVQED